MVQDTTRKVLVTAGRFMPTTGVIHALKRVGASVDIVDNDHVAPAIHSQVVAKAHVVDPPSDDPLRYADALADIVRARDIGLIVATFEDGFFLARYRDRLPVPVFVPAFEAIETLHNKARFAALCREIGLPVPRTEVATSQDGLRKALASFETYFARPAYTRGGSHNMTNHAHHVGERELKECRPGPDNPWIVQEFVEGRDACIFAVARGGKVELLCAYEPAIASTGGFSVRFATIDDPDALTIATAVCGRFGYTGFIGFDYRRSADGPVLFECNPRVTAGAFLCEETVLGRAILDGLDTQTIVPAGRAKQYDSYLMDPHVTGMPIRKIVESLLTAPDALVSQRDVMPFLYSFVYRSHVTREAHRHHVAVTDMALQSVSWDGSELPAAPA